MLRREFLQYSGKALLAALLSKPLSVMAARSSSAPAVLNPQQWRSVAAICDQIIPAGADGSAGAQAAGCVNFIDKLLSLEEKASLPQYQLGLAQLDAWALQVHQSVFAQLPAQTLVSGLEQLEDGKLPTWQDAPAQQQFFAALHFHTLLGFLAAPQWGGNRDMAGWKLMAFPGHVHEMGGVTAAQVSGEQPIIPLWQTQP